jgi:hypothetical protein
VDKWAFFCTASRSPARRFFIDILYLFTEAGKPLFMLVYASNYEKFTVNYEKFTVFLSLTMRNLRCFMSEIKFSCMMDI